MNKRKLGTLCFLVKDKKVLLAMKKRGFGVGKYNGTGGKVDVGETVKEAAIRETQEEIGVVPRSLDEVAVLDFDFPHKPEWAMRVTAFMVHEWTGRPRETEEMKPKWFEIAKVPYPKMWSSDSYWIPLVLEGKKIKTKFVFNKDESVKEFKIKFI